MEPKYVTFEQAKLLKEKGFDVQTVAIYQDGEILMLKSTISNSQFMTSRNFSAPEQWQVVEWLRVNHSIWVYSYTNGKIWYACIQHTFGDMVELPSRLGEHNSPQEAILAAFDYILNNNLI
jgi:hypothetical protein